MVNRSPFPSMVDSSLDPPLNREDDQEDTIDYLLGNHQFDYGFFPSHQTLTNNHSLPEDAFSRLSLSSATQSPYRSFYPNQQNQVFPSAPQLPVANDFFDLGNPSTMAFNQEFNPQLLAELRYLRYQQALAARMAASSTMGNFNFPSVSPNPLGFVDSPFSRSYRQSWLSDESIPLPSTGQCPLFNPQCYYHLNRQCLPRPIEDTTNHRFRPENRFRRRSLDLSSFKPPTFDRNLHRFTSNTLLQMRGQFYALAKDQHGCKILQNKLKEGTEEEINMIFLELKVHITKLMADQFGNYLVQELLAVCDEEKITEILHFVTRDQYELIDICCDTHGTRCVQKMLTYMKTPQQINRFLSALRVGVVSLSKDANGHHVIQHCMKHFSMEDNKYLYKEITDHCVEISVEQSGCCVLQNCLSAAEGELRDRLVNEITDNAMVLSQDKFGNYVIQFLVQMKIPNVTKGLMRQIKGNFESLSVQKFSSNVVQKFLIVTEEEESTEVIRELLNSNFLMIIQDQFGNYVAQSVLNVAKGSLFNAVIGIIDLHLQSLRNHPYGKRVVEEMNKIIGHRQQQQQHFFQHRRRI